MQIYNPSEELILAAGWIEYIPPEPTPIDYTKYEPYIEDVVDKLKVLLKEQITQQSDEQALDNIELFPTWQSRIGVQVNKGERLYFDDKLYKVLQIHTPQEDWRPDTTASLYSEVSIDEWPEWRQPLGSEDAYHIGDKVSHNDKHWQSTVDANIWEPGVYGWDEV